MKIYLTGQNNFGNRGCEALVRSTVDVIRARLPNAEFFVPSGDIARDSAQWPDASEFGAHFVAISPMPSRFIQWSRVCTRLPMLARLRWPKLHHPSEVPPGMAQADVLLSIGGDNYSLDYDLASLAYFVAVAEAGLARGIPVILWGASVGPFSAIPAVENKMSAHLRRLSQVTIRESHSVRYLAQIGVSANVTAVADSAFVLRPQALDVSAFWPEGGDQGVVGLNVSPLIEAVRARAGNRSDLLMEVEHFVRATVREHDLSVLLVPHVAPLDGAERNNDERLLATLAKRLTDLGSRVRVVPGGMNAVQLKYIIGRCRFFIGARTHATIAAMSMGVPTLSIAYSIKALGINRDLFGHERYVVDTRVLDAATLTAGLTCLRDDESAIRTLLAERLPRWRERASLGAGIVLAQTAKKSEVT
jgi:polysaccharide pyruvyl transferase WcaK-like protein